MLNYNPRVTFPINNGYAPAEGPRTVPIDLDFSTDGNIYVDCAAIQSEGHIGIIQSIWVDNSENPQPLIVTVKQSLQRLKFPALQASSQPVFAPQPAQFLFSTTPLATKINVQLLNVPLAPSQMGAITVNGAFSPAAGAYTDAASGTLAVAATSQILFAANDLRKGLYIQNPSAEIQSIWLNFGGVATLSRPSIELPVGAVFETQLQITNQQVQWIAATAGHAIIAKELN